MKHLVASTAKVEKRIDKVKIERMSGVSIVDKAMTHVEVSSINPVTNMYIFEVDIDEGVITQAIIESDVDRYSTSSSVAIDLVEELIEMVNDGDVALSDIGFNVSISVSRTGNKYLDLQLM